MGTQIQLFKAGVGDDAPTILTPEFLKNRAYEINVSITQLNDDIAQQKKAGKIGDDAPKLKAWYAFRDRWTAWYEDTSWWSWAWASTNATLEAYAGQVSDWIKWYQRAFGAPATGAPPTTYDSGARNLATVLPIVLGAAGAGILIYAFVRR